MLQNLGEDIWTTPGPSVAVMGFHYPTRMVVIRFADRSLFLWSPVALTPDLRRQVDALGTVGHIVAPNALHHLSVPDWQSAYPDAITYAAPGLRAKRRDIVFDRDLGEAPDPAWAQVIDQVVVAGNLITTEVVFFHIPSGTAIFTDLIQSFPPSWFSGWREVIARLDLMVAPEATVPRKFRLAFVRRGAARPSVARLTEWPIRQVLMAHGDPVTNDAKGVVVRAFGWLRV